VADPINNVTWWEIPVADLDNGARFFGAVFGWTFAPMGDGYRGVHADGVLIGGLFESPETSRGDGVRVYVNVLDLEANLVAAERAGGTIRRPRTEVGGDMGWWAEIADPAGRTLGLCTSQPARD
jgi:predicted enzyme related to lactoylglutathione lyase